MGRICMNIRQSFVDSIQNEISKNTVQAFLDFRGFDVHDFQFNAVYNSILFSSPLVQLSHLDLRDFLLTRFFFCVPKLTA